MIVMGALQEADVPILRGDRPTLFFNSRAKTTEPWNNSAFRHATVQSGLFGSRGRSRRRAMSIMNPMSSTCSRQSPLDQASQPCQYADVARATALPRVLPSWIGQDLDPRTALTNTQTPIELFRTNAEPGNGSGDSRTEDATPRRCSVASGRATMTALPRARKEPTWRPRNCIRGARSFTRCFQH